jgi:Ca2+/H+ antiporter
VIPAAYHSAKRTAHPRDRNLIEPTTAEPLIDDLNDNSQEGLLTISRGTAVLLLVVYIGYLIFQLKTHAYLFDKDPGHVRNEESDQDVEEDNIRMNIAMHSDESIQEVEEDNPRMNVVAAGLWHLRANNLVVMILLRKSSAC